jgi:alpha-L-arabinofuranosidase
MSNLIINTKQNKHTINRHIYGHFSEHLGRCIYGGLYLDGKLNAAAVKALQNIKAPVLRWPGGCFADEYCRYQTYVRNYGANRIFKIACGPNVDEWGTLYDVEPGTNPGFLSQQNTMRDALVAAVNLAENGFTLTIPKCSVLELKVK